MAYPRDNDGISAVAEEEREAHTEEIIAARLDGLLKGSGLRCRAVNQDGETYGHHDLEIVAEGQPEAVLLRIELERCRLDSWKDKLPETWDSIHLSGRKIQRDNRYDLLLKVSKNLEGYYCASLPWIIKMIDGGHIVPGELPEGQGLRNSDGSILTTCQSIWRLPWRLIDLYGELPLGDCHQLRCDLFGGWADLSEMIIWHAHSNTHDLKSE